MQGLIIGWGSIGRRHEEVLSKSFPQIKIDVVSRHESTRANFYKRIEDVRDLNKYDYILICTETALHKDQLVFIDRLVNGKKIFIEKPLFSDLPERDIFLNNQIYVGYNLRFHPVIQGLENILRKKEVISVIIHAGQYLPAWRPLTNYQESYSASKQKGGGVLLDLSHEIDYFTKLFGKISELYAINRKLSNLQIDSDDTMIAIGYTAKGTAFSLVLDYLCRTSQRSIQVQCQDSTIIADLISSKIEVIEDTFGKRTIDYGNVERNLSYSAMHKNIIYESGTTACTYEEALTVLEAVKKIQLSQMKDW